MVKDKINQNKNIHLYNAVQQYLLCKMTKFSINKTLTKFQVMFNKTYVFILIINN